MPFDVFDRLLRPLRRGTVTDLDPDGSPALSGASRGLPLLDASRCDASAACVEVCPTSAIRLSPEDATWVLDAGRCIFCAACARACPRDAIRLGDFVKLAARDRDDLVITTRREDTP